MGYASVLLNRLASQLLVAYQDLPKEQALRDFIKMLQEAKQEIEWSRVSDDLKIELKTTILDMESNLAKQKAWSKAEFGTAVVKKFAESISASGKDYPEFVSFKLYKALCDVAYG